MVTLAINKRLAYLDTKDSIPRHAFFETEARPAFLRYTNKGFGCYSFMYLCKELSTGFWNNAFWYTVFKTRLSQKQQSIFSRSLAISLLLPGRNPSPTSTWWATEINRLWQKIPETISLKPGNGSF